MRDFNYTINVLVQAFLKDELAHKTCSACAVGNIVAASLGTKPRKNDPDCHIEFDNGFFDDLTPTAWFWVLHGNDFKQRAISPLGCSQIKSTGYTIEELRQIENAFEDAPGMPEGEGLWRGKCVDPTWMFNGLMAVVDVLASIHGIDITQKEQAKKLFAKA